MYLQDIGILLESIIFEGKKSNELKVCKENLNDLDFQMLTADALYANKPMLTSLIESNKDFLLTSKQKKLNAELVKQSELVETIVKGSKVINVFKVPKDFEVLTTYSNKYEYDYTAKPKYNKVIKVHTKATYKTWNESGIKTMFTITSKEKDNTSPITRYYITSLDSTTGADRLESIARDRWSVENGLHRNKDMSFNEDKQFTTKLSSIGLLSTLRNFVISILHINGYQATTKTVRSLCNREEVCLGILGQRKLSRV